MSAPIVSLIVPVYNAEKYLQTLLQSVQKQSLPDFECICIDDGSVDKSVEIVQNYVKNDTRFNLVCNKKNLGVAAARNTGLELAGGKYVMFLDSDDFLHEKCMERAVSVMESSGADIYQFGYIDVLPEQKILNKEYTATPKYKLKNNLLSKFLQNKLPKSVLIWDKIYKADIAKKITFKNVQPGEDDLYSFETMAVSENMALGTDILLYHTDNADSMMHKVINEKYTEMRKKVTDEFGLILRKNLENYSKSPKLRTKLIKYYNEHFLFKEYILKPIRKSKLTPDMIAENIGMVEQKIMADKSGNTPLRLRYKIILWLLRKKFYGPAKFIIF